MRPTPSAVWVFFFCAGGEGGGGGDCGRGGPVLYLWTGWYYSRIGQFLISWFESTAYFFEVPDATHTSRGQRFWAGRFHGDAPDGGSGAGGGGGDACVD